MGDRDRPSLLRVRPCRRQAVVTGLAGAAARAGQVSGGTAGLGAGIARAAARDGALID